jgi:NADH-quinone oxidoreductase subunit N
VYEGAPAPVTAFLATVSKVAVFALLVRYCTALNLQSSGAVATVLAAVAILSMIVGNLLALLQTNIKRVLAYSSIAHMGYVLVALLAGGKMALSAVGYYLAAYSLTTVGAFGVISILSGPERDADRMEDFRGLAWKRPLVAGIFTIMLLSLAGIPLTAGFVGKFYVMVAGVGSAMWLMVITLVVTSVIGLFYYLRIVAQLFLSPEANGVGPAWPAASRAGSALLVLLAFLIIWWGVFPSQLIQIIEKTVAVLGT